MRAFISATCRNDDEMTGPNYVYLTYAGDPEVLLYTPMPARYGPNAINGTDSTVIWSTLRLGNFTQGGRVCIGAVWMSDRYEGKRLTRWKEYS